MQTWKPTFYACEVMDRDSSQRTPTQLTGPLSDSATHFYLACKHASKMTGTPFFIRDTSPCHSTSHTQKLLLITELNTHMNHSNIEWPKHEISSSSIYFNFIKNTFYQNNDLNAKVIFATFQICWHQKDLISKSCTCFSQNYIWQPLQAPQKTIPLHWEFTPS